MKVARQQYRRVKLADLKPHPRNPRRGNVAAIEESIERNGFVGTLLVQKSTGYVLAGNHRLQAAKESGARELPAMVVDVDDETALRILLADNRTSDLAGYDDPELHALLQEVGQANGTLEGTGYGLDDFKELERELARLSRAEGDLEPEPVEPPAEPRSVAGEVYELGPHRLMCGDAVDALASLYAGVKVGAVLTDPPYGINLETDYTKLPIGSSLAEQALARKRRTYRPVIGDDRPFDAGPFAEAFAGVHEQFWFGGDFYRRTLSPDDLDGSWLVWDKRNESTDVVIGSGFELIWSKKAHKRDLLRHYWCGAMGSAEARGRYHPTQKPTPLLVEILDRWAPAGCIVADPFAGAGSVLIACEMVGRTCYAVEIDPGYCDVIRDRYEAFVALQAA